MIKVPGLGTSGRLWVEFREGIKLRRLSYHGCIRLGTAVWNRIFNTVPGSRVRRSWHKMWLLFNVRRVTLNAFIIIVPKPSNQCGKANSQIWLHIGQSSNRKKNIWGLKNQVWNAFEARAMRRAFSNETRADWFQRFSNWAALAPHFISPANCWVSCLTHIAASNQNWWSSYVRWERDQFTLPRSASDSD